MLLLDALAHRYGTTPWDVLFWSPEKLAFNAMCLDQAQATAAHTIERTNNQGGMVFPVVVLGGG